MRQFITALVLALVSALLCGHAPCAAASDALSADNVEMLLGEWVLESTRNRVPTPDNPSGAFPMSGNTVNAKLTRLANSSELASMDNVQLSEALQRRVVSADKSPVRSVEVVVVSANVVTGTAVAYNMYKPRNERVIQKRMMGVASRTFDGEGAPVVQFTGGEQPHPADWTLRWAQDAAGEWQMQAVRVQRFQIPAAGNVTADFERQAVLAMGPFVKTNATLAELLPKIVGRFRGGE